MSATDIARRRFFRRMAGSTAAVLLSRIVPARPLAALPGLSPDDLAQAVATGDREVVARFILASPDRANAAPLQDRAAALRLMAHGRSAKDARQGKPIPANKGPACAGCQRASVVLVEHSQDQPAELRAFVAAVGQDWLESALPKFQEQALRTRVTEGLRLIGASRG